MNARITSMMPTNRNTKQSKKTKKKEQKRIEMPRKKKLSLKIN